jgi:hypothetical protein
MDAVMNPVATAYDRDNGIWTCSSCGAVNTKETQVCGACGREPRTTLTDGTQVYPGHRAIVQSGPRAGQQEDYVVLSDDERAKGFVRPVRYSYKHLACGGVTTMARPLAETYARNPAFYSGTFCVRCGAHFPVGEHGQFVWDGTDIKVGT